VAVPEVVFTRLLRRPSSPAPPWVLH